MATVSSGDSGLKNSSVDILDAARFRVCLYTIIFTVVIAVTVSILFAPGWMTATFFAALIMIVLSGFIVVRRDALGAKFMMFCLAAGFVELLADWYLINIHRSLTYMPGGPFVWASPLYMPFAWTVTLFMNGVIGRWADRRWGLAAATVLTVLLAWATWIYGETAAKYAGWWYYHDTPMLASSPYYIIFGEILIAGLLPLTFRVLNRVPWIANIGVGIVFGLWILISYRVGIQIFG